MENEREDDSTIFNKKYMDFTLLFADYVVESSYLNPDMTSDILVARLVECSRFIFLYAMTLPENKEIKLKIITHFTDCLKNDIDSTDCILKKAKYMMAVIDELNSD